MVQVKEMGNTVTVEVDRVDEEVSRTMERDSNMEIEMMELFEDLTLEDIVVNKACVGKVMGCKNMAASVVKKILLGIWKLEATWRMKKFEDGVLGFFFESEADCAFVMNKRPWLVNGVLLNLKPFPVEGEVRVCEFELWRFWVEFHGLPTRCLSETNIPVLAKKVGQLVKSDGKSKEETVRRGFLRCWIDVWLSHPILAGFFFKSGSNPEVWIQFKYEKLPFLCFNCGKLAHSNRECLAPTAWVTPPAGAAVRMYGPWIKVEGPPGYCFSAASFRREMVLCDESVKLTKENPKVKGRWTRRLGLSSLEDGNDSVPTTAVQPRSDDKGKRTREGTLHGTVHGGGRTDCTKNDEVAEEVGRNVVQKVVSDESRVSCLNIPPQKALVELPIPDFSNVGQGEENEVLPDIGPSLIQSLDIPHIWTCKSQIPHHFPEPTHFKWPTNDPELQKLYCNLLGPDYTNMYQAQPSLIANPPNVSEMISHLLGAKKRKAKTWYHPIPEKLKESIFDNEGNDPGSCSITVSQGEGSKDATGTEVTIEPFNPGTSEKHLKPRPRKGLRGQASLIRKSNSGVKTRRGRKRIQEATEGGEEGNPINLANVLAQCVDVPITFVQNFGNGEEAALVMPPPSP
uniref:CCHC-type domain-containing protein n=1 Tax=Cannabis sativa TaxID=3483 RepID=A0A803PR24_CANSA